MDEMTKLDDLGVALHPRRAPSEKLRDRVLTATAPRSARPVRSRWLVPSLATAAVTAVAIGVVALLPDSGGTTARTDQAGGRAGQGAATFEVRHASFTLVRSADGSVTFTALQLVDTDAATQALNAAGIAGRALNEDPACTAGPGGHGQIEPADLYPPDTLHSKLTGLAADDTVTFRSSDYPEGGGLLLAVGTETGKGATTTKYAAGVFAYADANKIPTCINFTDPGTGQ